MHAHRCALASGEDIREDETCIVVGDNSISLQNSMAGANINDRCANLEGISKKEHISIDLVSKSFRESADLTWVLELNSVLQKRK